MVTKRNNNRIGLGMVALSCMMTACTSDFIPEIKDAFDKDATFSQVLYKPTLGRNNLITKNFNAGNSTQPLKFTLVSLTRSDGSEAPELTEAFPVKIWKTPYLGTEKSLAEIEAKRGYENRPLFQVREYSGEMIMWANARSSFVKCAPDSGYVFTVKVENKGGWNIYRNMRLIPNREHDFEPDNVDASTGIVTQDYVNPSTVKNMYMEGKNVALKTSDIKVFFRENKEATDSVPTLTFRFMGPDYQPIDPAKFNQTDWANLVHGFNMEKTSEYVKYQVAYPIPLYTLASKYTNKAGDKAHLRFKYDRLRYGTLRETSYMDFDFAIYKEGHWEIIFVFANGAPEFTDNN